MTCYLVSGPIMTTPSRRQAAVKRMADILIETGICGDREDHKRVLHNRGCLATEVHVLLDDVRALAFQEVVAEIMSAS